MLTIDTTGRISIDGQQTGLGLSQRQDCTVIHTPYGAGRAYAEHLMPHARYSATHDEPASVVAGRLQLAADLRDLLGRL